MIVLQIYHCTLVSLLLIKFALNTHDLPIIVIYYCNLKDRIMLIIILPKNQKRVFHVYLTYFKQVTAKQTSCLENI